MGTFKNGKKAFQQYTKSGKLILKPPFVGFRPPKSFKQYREVPLDLCCTTTSTTSTTSTSSTTTTTTTEV